VVQAIALSCVTPASGGVVAQCAAPSVLRATRAPPGAESSCPGAPTHICSDVQVMVSRDEASAPFVDWPETASTGLIVVVVVVEVIALIDVVVRWFDSEGRSLEQPPNRPAQASATRISPNPAGFTSRSCHPGPTTSGGGRVKQVDLVLPSVDLANGPPSRFGVSPKCRTVSLLQR
jgi:hypothetical protein